MTFLTRTTSVDTSQFSSAKKLIMRTINYCYLLLKSSLMPKYKFKNEGSVPNNQQRKKKHMCIIFSDPTEIGKF